MSVYPLILARTLYKQQPSAMYGLISRRLFPVALAVGMSVTCLTQATVSWAQNAPIPTNQTNTPAILQDLEKKNKTPEPPLPKDKPADAPVDDQQKKPGDEAAAADIAFEVNRISVMGITYLSPSEYQPLVSSYEGKELKFSDLQTLATQLSKLYEDKGYVTSKVIIPEQEVKNGMVMLEAVEGFVGENAVIPGKYFKAQAISTRLAPLPAAPVDLDVVKRTLRRINQSSPDMKVQATLKAGKNPKETDIDYTIYDKHPWHLTPFYDNLGRKLIGRQRMGGTFVHNNLLGFGDSSATSASVSSNSFGLAESYAIPLGSHGTTLGFDYAHSMLHLGEELEILNVRGTASSYTPHITQEFYNTENVRLYGDMAFDVKYLRTKVLDQLFSYDRLRVVRPALTLEVYDKSGSTAIRNEPNIGLDIFGATDGNHSLPSRVGAGSKFFAWTTNITRLQKLPLNSYGVFRFQGQYSPDRLVAAQQMQIGGAFSVRGYTEGRLIGDSGFLFSGEWRLPSFFIPKHWVIPYTDINLHDNIQFVTFLEGGGVFTNKATVGTDPSDYLLGTGIGLRMRLTKYLVGRVDFAVPVLRQAPDTSQPRFHFGLQSELF